MNNVELLIRYVESGLDVAYLIAPDALLDEATLERNFKYAVCKFGRELLLEQVGLSKISLAPYTFHATGGALIDDEGKPQRAFTGELHISLKAEEKEKGFPALLQKKEQELRRLHAQLVELQYPGSKDSEGKQLGKGKNTQKGKGMEIVNEGLKSEIEGLKSKIEGLKSKIEGLKSKIEGLKSKGLKNEGWKSEITGLKKLVEVLNEDKRLADKVKLRIALEAAHNQLVKDLGREPANESSWRDFIETITPAERLGLGGKLSGKALALMGTGKKELNRVVHSGFTIDIVTAITCVQQKQESWIEIFKYGYNKDPIEIVFNLEV